ncbi:PilZ domain-containing protein [Novosphingobium sp. FKTRR1]|uniref:PilZ domain-containing protein n=1 Tax=Novosphingobium sp. FKTRR1 TaxID=2879118 RepID=UPI001CF0763B|nr:PilZ domain-containing protein [Novosphingobium sp. FKTRR1]
MRTQSPEPQPAGSFHGIADGARRAPRVGVELPVRGKAGLMRSTFLLTDLTPQGARIGGIGIQRVGEPITLLLPGAARPTIAFVIWANPSTAGLEFLDPLDEELFASLVADYAIGQAPLLRQEAAPVQPAHRLREVVEPIPKQAQRFAA